MTEGEDVTQRVLADVAAGLRNHQQDGDVSHQPAHRVHESVETVERDEPRDAEERSGRQVITCNRPAILQPGEASACGIKIRACFYPLGREIGHEQRETDDRAENREGQNPPLRCDCLRERGLRREH